MIATLEESYHQFTWEVYLKNMRRFPEFRKFISNRDKPPARKYDTIWSKQFNNWQLQSHLLLDIFTHLQLPQQYPYIAKWWQLCSKIHWQSPVSWIGSFWENYKNISDRRSRLSGQWLQCFVYDERSKICCGFFCIFESVIDLSTQRRSQRTLSLISEDCF